MSKIQRVRQCHAENGAYSWASDIHTPLCPSRDLSPARNVSPLPTEKRIHPRINHPIASISFIGSLLFPFPPSNFIAFSTFSSTWQHPCPKWGGSYDSCNRISYGVNPPSSWDVMLGHLVMLRVTSVCAVERAHCASGHHKLYLVLAALSFST